jgi:hypothetical protein
LSWFNVRVGGTPLDGTSPYRRKQVATTLIASVSDVVQPVREVEAMTAKDYIDTKGYWISPDRTIRRMGDEGGEQVAIAKATEECSDAEWNRICDALKVSLFKID